MKLAASGIFVGMFAMGVHARSAAADNAAAGAPSTAQGASAAQPGAFLEYGAGVRPRPAEQLRETACELDIELRGAVAVVELRQRIANPAGGSVPLAASLELALPAGAQILGFSLRGDSGAPAEAALPVDAASPSVVGAQAEVLGIDPALLVRTPGSDASRDAYRIVLQPIAPAHEVLATTRYVALARPRGGALELQLPGHAAIAGTPFTCKATARATPGPGASIKKLRAGGAEVAGGRALAFPLDGLGTALRAELEVAGKQPIAWAQTQPLGDGWSASVVTVLGPRVPAIGPRRAIFVIDGSRSMDLVGRHNVIKVVQQLGAKLPAGSEVDAILYDRTAARVFGQPRPATPESLGAIEAAIAQRGASNGSDLAGALALAKQALDGARTPALLILVTDGVTGELDGRALVRALDAKTSALDVHAVVLDPARTRSPGGAALRAPVQLYGGAYVEVNVAELDDALTEIDEWLRPSWLELKLGGAAIPSEVRAGGGFAQAVLHKGALRSLSGRGDAAFTAQLAAAPAAPIAALALGAATAADFTGEDEPTEADAMVAEPILARALAAHPFASGARSFAVLATTGRVAKSRRQMVAGGGRYERVVAIADPPSSASPPSPPAPPGPSAIARATLERLFRDQLQPKAYACYQRALGRNAKLAGTVHYQLRLGRGEVTAVSLTGLGDAQLDACLLDAAYLMTPPMPDFTINADDQTIANYPLTLQRRDDQPVIVLGDADSQSPLDIDAIQGGVPAAPGPRKPIKHPDASTPLGGLRPSAP